MRTTIAFLIAAFVPVLFLTAYYAYGALTAAEANDGYVWIRIRGFAVISTVVSTGYVAFLGVPAFLLLKWKSAIRWWSSVVVGFLLGGIPVAVLAWPLRYSGLKTSASVDGVQTMIAGVPTGAGWLQYAGAVGFVGLCGAIGGLSFWVVWRNKSK